MTASPLTVNVVLDPEFGEQVFQLAESGPVWIKHSPANRAAVEQYWSASQERSNTVTIWSNPHTGATEEEWLVILSELDMHHAEPLAGPSIATLDVFGVELTAHAEAALREFGYETVEARAGGFRAHRRDAG